MRRLVWRLLARLLDRVDARVCAWPNLTHQSTNHHQEQP